MAVCGQSLLNYNTISSPVRINPVETDLDSFIRTFRSQRAPSRMTSLSRDYPPTSNVEIKKPMNANTTRLLPSVSFRDIQKMKYKIDLDKQVAEKNQRHTREWETKLEGDKKYVKQQAFFGRQDPTVPIKKQDLEQILIQSHVPSPFTLNKPEQLSLHYQQASVPNRNNESSQSQQPTSHNYSQSTNYSTMQPKPSSTVNNFSQNSNHDYQHFYGLNTYANGNSSQISPLTTTAQPVKGDAHDPFISFDPNKEPQQVFNIIPQQNLYEPWGRPGAGAPLIHQETGQKFTRYAGSLEDKLNIPGPLGFYRRQYSGNINDQKHDAEIQHQRRQQERMERRLNAGDTADWISQIEGSHYPLKFHLPTTKTTRHHSGTHDPYSSEETRSMYNDLARQADERARLQQTTRYEDNLADLHHTEVQNSWWSREGASTSQSRNHRYNAQNTPGKPRTKWVPNHLGQVMMVDDTPSNSVKYNANYASPKRNFPSNHTNYYQLPDRKNS